MGDRVDRVIYIYRNRTGQFRVFPSPVVVATGSTVAFKNLGEEEASVDLAFEEPIRVPPGTLSRAATIPPDRQGYEEYQVLVAGRYQAEGTSPPGFIVDP